MIQINERPSRGSSAARRVTYQGLYDVGSKFWVDERVTPDQRPSPDGWSRRVLVTSAGSSGTTGGLVLGDDLYKLRRLDADWSVLLLELKATCVAMWG